MFRGMSVQRLWCGFAILGIFASCGGADKPLVFFPPAETTQLTPGADADQDVSGRRCDITFTSQLCVQIKGSEIEAGVAPGEELCAEVPAFPLHIQGSEITLRGNEFPDIPFEGHSLPVPILINGKGAGSGEENIGKGEIDPLGNIEMKGFSFYINALGESAQVGNVTFSTGSISNLEFLPAASGSVPDASGAMTLLAGTTIGHTFDAADETLMGASMLATFKGSISPSLAECGGNEAPRGIEIKKLSIAPSGEKIEATIPDEKILEISSGTYLSKGPQDVGPLFEATQRFKVSNVSGRKIKLQIPSRVGPFVLQSNKALARDLAPKESFQLNISFIPKAPEQSAGKIEESLLIGTDLFTLTGVVLEQGGRLAVSELDNQGETQADRIDRVDFGDSSVIASSEKDFFKCTEITCGQNISYTNCQACPNPETSACVLLPVTQDGKAVGEVDQACAVKDPQALPISVIDLHGSSNIEMQKQSQLIAIRNYGVSELTINNIQIQELANSKSTGQFFIPQNAMAVAEHYSDVQQKLTQAANAAQDGPQAFPIILPPYRKGYQEATLYALVIYKPSDLLGAQGDAAGRGSFAIDRAQLVVTANEQVITTQLQGRTTIEEVPALELYFKTSIGVKKISNAQSFSMPGITAKTKDLAIPLFLRLSDSASSAMRITSIQLISDDTNNFQWLDTREEIQAVQPNGQAGEGMRCSIPILDPSTNQMTGEVFDLKPVSLSPPGFDLNPGAHSIENMPLFGCVNFHRDTSQSLSKRVYQGNIIVTTQILDASKNPQRNPDGTFVENKFNAKVIATIDAIQGKMVLRVTQSMTVIQNPQFPIITSTTVQSEFAKDLANGIAKPEDINVFLGALLLDPFDKDEIRDSSGQNILSTANDGITAVFRALTTHPVSTQYENPFLADYASLLNDTTLPVGERGIFEDYPNVPENLQTNGWRIFTTSLSFPGPINETRKRPIYPSQCKIINPCSEEDLKKYSEQFVPLGEPGACTFFYSGGGRYDSPAFHTPEQIPGGELVPFCSTMDKKPKLLDMNTGHYSLDGHVVVEEVGFRMSGPTFFNNPYSPLGKDFPPLDGILYTAFTTGSIHPQKNPDEPNSMPEPSIDIGKQMFKVNLTDPKHVNPALCEPNKRNRTIDGKEYSTWKYLKPLLSQDEEAKIPAGCPNDGEDFKGGVAFLHGRPLDQETGQITFVSAVRFPDDPKKFTFALKDLMVFFVLNGWACNPEGLEENFEGAKCFDQQFNERDAKTQITIVDD